MKLQLTVALGLAVLATPAFATKARLQALGEDTYGSFYINDNRNIWLNAAQISNHKDLVTYEFGDNANLNDSAATPRAEGGVYKAIGNLVYGVHFGSASNTANALRLGAGLGTYDLTGATAPTGANNEQNNVDAFVGGDTGVKWGANIGYAKSSDQNVNNHSESMRTRLGVIMGDTQVYANVNLINNAKGQTNGLAGAGVPTGSGTKFEGKLGYQVGAIHNWEGNSFTVDYRSFDSKANINNTGNKDQELKQLIVGAGRVTRLNDKTNLFTKAQFVNATAVNKTILGGTTGLSGSCSSSPFFCRNYKTSRVPVVVGIETEATSWLTLRASVAQAVWGSEDNKSKERSIKNNTVVNAGATLKFGELSVDGVIGNNSATGAVGESTSAGNGSLRTDNLMTRVGMTYRF
jgi:hypothetical protein